VSGLQLGTPGKLSLELFQLLGVILNFCGNFVWIYINFLGTLLDFGAEV